MKGAEIGLIMQIHILHNTPLIGRKSFGLGQVALNLVQAQNETGCLAQIWCLDKPEEIRWAVESTGISEKQIVSFQRVGIARLHYSHAMMSAANRNQMEFDIVHQHGIWTACSLTSTIFRRKHKIPIIIAPHGSLEKLPLKKSVWKKKLALIAYENSNLHNASCLHATSEAEVGDFRNFGLKNPIALISNGVSEQSLCSQGIARRFLEDFNLPYDRRILFFLSRITPKKGIPMLLKAIQRLGRGFADWLLVIAGTDEFDHKKEVESLVSELGLNDMVRLLGPLYDQNKRDAFAAANVFILPSYSEGSPMVVLDCMAVGVPVITTKGTPWKSLETFQCGWWVDATVDGLIQALQVMLELSPEQLKVMGRRGKELVKSQYLWTVQARKTIDLYEWLLGRKSKPDFVITN